MKNREKGVPRDRIELSTHGFSVASWEKRHPWNLISEYASGAIPARKIASVARAIARGKISLRQARQLFGVAEIMARSERRAS